MTTIIVVDGLWFGVLLSHGERKQVHTEEQKKAIAAIDRLGGEFWGDLWTGVDFRETDVRNAQLIYVGCLSVLNELDLSVTQVTDPGLIHLGELSDLERNC